MEVEVVAAPPEDAITDDEAPVAEDLEASLAGLMGRNDDMCIYKSFCVFVKAEAGAAGNVPVKEATSWEAVLDKSPPDPDGRTLGEFGVTSTNVAVLGVLPADVGLVRVKSVAEGVGRRLRSRAFNHSGTDPASNRFLVEY